MSDVQRVFITGGASGLGRALAIQYARAGWAVVIADVHDGRGAETLKELSELAKQAGTAARFVPRYFHADVTCEAELQAIADALEADWQGIDVLYNNAGVAQAGAIEDVSLSDWEWIVNINLLGVVRGCKIFTPGFKRQGSGHIVNIASMAGLLDVPRMASYNVTKAAVVALSGTLTHELMDAGIGVSVVCPSFFPTNLEDTMRSTDPGLKKMMNKLLASGKLSADEVAERIIAGVKKGQQHILPHESGERLWLLKRYLPQGMYRYVFQRSIQRMKPRNKR
ncbi:SDR family oxidoreductase [Paraperlucidibaca sp.]|uniref:SDR family oxidoreductase n=1 Tax=Paraperlucidibaca sp. TaxID=2708021 RepID=UPI0030F439A8